MATIARFLPESATLSSSSYPSLHRINDRFVLAFDASTDEFCYWSDIAPQGLTTPLTLYVKFFMDTATADEIVFDCSVEAVSSGDTIDLDSTTGFDTTNTSSAITIPSTAGYPGEFSITLTNNDNIVAGDFYRIRLNRDANNAADDATGDCFVFAVELRDSA